REEPEPGEESEGPALHEHLQRRVVDVPAVRLVDEEIRVATVEIADPTGSHTEDRMVARHAETALPDEQALPTGRVCGVDDARGALSQSGSRDDEDHHRDEEHPEEYPAGPSRHRREREHAAANAEPGAANVG